MEDITDKRYENGRPKLRRFQQAKWDEALIFELSTPGARGILVPEVEAELATQVGDVVDNLPDGVARKTPPALPEMSQPEVLRHYLRLSQETLGVDFNVDVGQGTCTMKYSPKIHEQFVAMPQVAALHPLQDESTAQGNAASSMIRAYHAERGESQRDEVITTYCSHPSDAACAKTAGFKVITLHSDENGYPDTEALKAAVSNRTAALLVANPEDTGIFNPRIEEWVQIVHDAGGVCFYDQANVNGIMGITRARDAGFDMCHFNLHKSFSTPHACGGPAVGALGVSEQMIPFLPGPIVCCENGVYSLQQPPKSIGKVGAFFGSTANFVRAYAWVMNLGADGLRSVAEIAVLNNNYLYSKVKQIDGVDACLHALLDEPPSLLGSRALHPGAHRELLQARAG